MDDLNLYDDLDEFQEQHEKKSKELQEAEEKYQQSLKTIDELKAENQTLKKDIKCIKLGFQSLLDTARAEIRRKDKEIERLRKEKDDICFRRKTWTKPANTNSDTNFSVNNPFKYNEVKCNEIPLIESASTSAEVCDDGRPKPEKRKHDGINEEREKRSAPKKQLDALNDNEDKYYHNYSKHHKVPYKTEDEYQSKKDRYRERDRNRIYEKDYHSSRSRDRTCHEPLDDRFKKTKSSSKSSERNEKESHRNRSRERDKHKHKTHNSKESSRHKTHPVPKSTSRSPPNRMRSVAVSKHDHFKSDKNSMKIETENSRRLFDKDLGNDDLTNLNTKQDGKRSAHAEENLGNSLLQIDQETEKEKRHKDESHKETKSNSQSEVKAPEGTTLNTPTRVVLFDEIFGKTPSVSGSIPRTSNTSCSGFKGTPKQTSQIEVISSVTTSPENYTDIESSTTTPDNRTAAIVSGILDVSRTDKTIGEERKMSRNEIDECFTLNPSAEEKNLKTIGCVDLTNIVEDNENADCEFIEIPGLDLCSKSKATKMEDNKQTVISIREKLETLNEESHITRHKLPPERNEKTSTRTDAMKLKKKLDRENCDDAKKKHSVQVADDNKAQQTNKTGLVSLECDVSNIQQFNMYDVQNLEAPSYVRNLLDKTLNILNKTPNSDKVVAKETEDFTNEVVVIDAKQCGGIVPLKNPYKILENEQKSLISNETKTEDSFGISEMQVVKANCEYIAKNEKANESHVDENKQDVDNTDSACSSKSPNVERDNSAALKINLEENLCVALKVQNYKTPGITLPSNEDTLVGHNTEINSSKFVPESIDCEKISLEGNPCKEQLAIDQVDLPPQKKEVSTEDSEILELENKDQSSDQIASALLYLNKKEASLSQNIAEQNDAEEQLFNGKQLEAKTVKKHLLNEDQIESLSQIKIDESNIFEEIFCTEENKSCNVELNSLSNSTENHIESDDLKKVFIETEQGEKKTLDQEKLNRIVKVDKSHSIEKDEAVESSDTDLVRETASFASSTKKLSQNYRKPLNKNPNVIVQSVEMLPPIKIVQSENEYFIGSNDDNILFRSAIEKTLNAAQIVDKNLNVMKPFTPAGTGDEATAQKVPGVLAENVIKIKETLQENQQIIDLCSPLKIVPNANEKISLSPAQETFGLLEKTTNTKDCNAKERSFEHVKSSQDICLVETKISVREDIKSAFKLPPNKSCTLSVDNSVENVKLKADKYPSSTIEQSGKSESHEKSFQSETIPIKPQIVEVSPATHITRISPETSSSTEPFDGQKEGMENNEILCTVTETIEILHDNVVDTEKESLSSTADREDLKAMLEKSIEISDIINEEASSLPKEIQAEDKKKETVEEDNLCDSVEMWLSKLHGIQDGQSEPVVLPVSDINLTNELKKTTKETQFPSTDILLTNEFTDISQNEQQMKSPLKKNTTALLFELEKKETEVLLKTETCSNETLACASTKMSQKSLTLASCQDENLSTNESNTKSSLKEDAGNTNLSVTLTTEKEDPCSGSSKQDEVINNIEEIKDESILVGNIEVKERNKHVNPQKLETCNQNQPLIEAEKTLPIKRKYRRSYSVDSSFANFNPKDNFLKKAKFMEPTKKETDESCSKLPPAANLTEKCHEPRNTPNELEDHDKCDKLCLTGSINAEKHQEPANKSDDFKDDNTPTALPSTCEDLTKEHATNLCQKQEIIKEMPTALEIEEFRPVNLDKTLQTASNSFESITSKADNKNESYLRGCDKFSKQKSALADLKNEKNGSGNPNTKNIYKGEEKSNIPEGFTVGSELRNDAKENYESCEMGYKELKKSNISEGITTTMQKNQSLLKESRIFDAENPKNNYPESAEMKIETEKSNIPKGITETSQENQSLLKEGRILDDENLKINESKNPHIREGVLGTIQEIQSIKAMMKNESEISNIPEDTTGTIQENQSLLKDCRISEDENPKTKSLESGGIENNSEKSIIPEGIAGNVQENQSLLKGCRILDTENPNINCPQSSCYSLSNQQLEFGKVSLPLPYNSVLCRENEMTSLNTNNLPQSFADTKKIIYMKKVISKEINMEGEIVEVVKDIVHFDETQSTPTNITKKELKEWEKVAVKCDNQQYKKNPCQQQTSLLESQKDHLPESLHLLPSIAPTFPTPSNFSGIFSKTPLSLAASEEESNKTKKKSSNLNAKRKEYILPAASVLCNVDNLENATKNNKKLRWELLDNKNEMTEIEDDADIDMTDNEELKTQENPSTSLSSSTKHNNLPKSSPSETDTQTEDESLLNYVRRQKEKYKKLKHSKLHKIKPKLSKASAVRKVIVAPAGDNAALQYPSLIVTSKRPVGRPRKSDVKHKVLAKTLKTTLNKATCKPKNIDDTKIEDNNETPLIRLQESTEAAPKSTEEESEKLLTSTCCKKSTKSQALNEYDRNILDDYKNLEHSVRSLSSSVEKLEICDEPCSSKDSFKQKKSLETQILDSKNQDVYSSTLLLHHKPEFSKEATNTLNEKNLAPVNELLREKIDATLSTTTSDKEKISQIFLASRETLISIPHKNCALADKAERSSLEEQLTSDHLKVPSKDILVPAKDRPSWEKPTSCTESLEKEQEPKSSSLTKPELKKSCPSITMKNKGKNFISLEDIGIKVRPPKVHLSTFRIPKIKKSPDKNSWKLENYVEPEIVENKNKLPESNQQEKVAQERKPEDENKPQSSASKHNADKRQTKSNLTEEVAKKDKFPADKQITQTAKSLNTIDDVKVDTKPGRRKLFSASMHAESEETFEHRNATKVTTKSPETCRKQNTNLNQKSQQPDRVRQRRKTVHISSQITEPICDEIKSSEHSTKPISKAVKFRKRILDSSSDDEDNEIVAKKLKLSPDGLNKTARHVQLERNKTNVIQNESIGADLENPKPNRHLRKRSKSMYADRSLHLDAREENNAEVKTVGKKEAIIYKTCLPSTEKERSISQQMTKAEKPLKMPRKELNATKVSSMQLNRIDTQDFAQKTLQQTVATDKHHAREIVVLKQENKVEGKDSKKVHTTEKDKADSDLTSIVKQQDRLSRRRKSINQRRNSDDDNDAGHAIPRNIDSQLKSHASSNPRTSTNSAAELTTPKEIKVRKKSVSIETDMRDKLNVSAKAHDVPNSPSAKPHQMDVTAILNQNQTEDDRNTKNPTAVTNAVEGKFTVAEKPKSRRRRVVKVLSSSMDSSINSTTISQQPSPFTSPLNNHSIFNNEVTTQSTEFPSTANQQDDDELNEIDSKLCELYKMPIDRTGNTDKNVSTAAAGNPLTTASPVHFNTSSSANTTSQEECHDVDPANDCSAVNNSQQENQTLSNNSIEVKYLSMGSSEYRIEKVSDNIVNLFISRKRKRKSNNSK